MISMPSRMQSVSNTQPFVSRSYGAFRWITWVKRAARPTMSSGSQAFSPAGAASPKPARMTVSVFMARSL